MSPVKGERGKEQKKNLHFLVWFEDRMEKDPFPAQVARRWHGAARNTGCLHLLSEWDLSAEKQL